MSRQFSSSHAATRTLPHSKSPHDYLEIRSTSELKCSWQLVAASVRGLSSAKGNFVNRILKLNEGDERCRHRLTI